MYQFHSVLNQVSGVSTEEKIAVVVTADLEGGQRPCKTFILHQHTFLLVC